MNRYKQIMRFVKAQENIPTFPRPEDDPFSEANLEAAYHREDRIKYADQERVEGKLHHRSVMFICHDIFVDVIKQANTAPQKARETKQAPKQDEELRKIEARLNALNAKMDDLDRPSLGL